MKNTFLTLTLFTLGAGSALAQMRVMADVPFGFQVPGATLEAGKYILQENAAITGNRVLELVNVDTRKAVLLIGSQVSKNKADGKSEMLFNCWEKRCALASVCTFDGDGRTFKAPRKIVQNGPMEVARVPLTRPEAD